MEDKYRRLQAVVLDANGYQLVQLTLRNQT